MRFLWNDKDGGNESRVWMYGLEIKSLFSILILRFENGSREAYHSHAFNCINWVLNKYGRLVEHRADMQLLHGSVISGETFDYRPSFKPFQIRRQDLHKVTSCGRTWVLSLRGPWANTWIEYLPNEQRFVKLTNGRKEV